MTDTREKLQLTQLGELGLRREGGAIPLPASRKTRALLAFLALNPKPQRRDKSEQHPFEMKPFGAWIERERKSRKGDDDGGNNRH